MEFLNPAFANFKHIQNIDLSNNNIVDFSHLALMPFVMSINLMGNNVKDLKSLSIEEGFKNLLVTSQPIITNKVF